MIKNSQDIYVFIYVSIKIIDIFFYKSIYRTYIKKVILINAILHIYISKINFIRIRKKIRQVVIY